MASPMFLPFPASHQAVTHTPDLQVILTQQTPSFLGRVRQTVSQLRSQRLLRVRELSRGSTTAGLGEEMCQKHNLI